MADAAATTSWAVAAEVGPALASRAAGGVDVAVFPPFPYLLPVAGALTGTGVLLGAQDAYHQPDGAFTGEVSMAMLRDCGVQAVLAGHSERRHVIGEDDRGVNRKVGAALEAGLLCVLCVGETLEEREAGQAEEKVASQIRAGLAKVKADQVAGLVIASPANPTGTMIDRERMTDLVAWCAEHDVRLVSDEIYHGITYPADPGAPDSRGVCVWDVPGAESAVVVSSFSKYWGMTGWRLGWALLPEDLRGPVDALAGNVALCPPAPAQLAALAAFSPATYAETDERVAAAFVLAGPPIGGARPVVERAEAALFAAQVVDGRVHARGGLLALQVQHRVELLAGKAQVHARA